MKNKKVQLAALGTLLAAVIAVGGWLILRTPGEKAPDEPPAGSTGTLAAAEAQTFDISSFKPSTYRPVRQETENIPLPSPTSPYPLNDVFSYDNQFCVFSYRQGISEGDFSVDIVSMASGEVLRTYDAEEFYEGSGHFTALALDQDGSLWYAYHDGEQAVLAPCKAGLTEKDVFSVRFVGEPTSLAVQDGCFVLRSEDGIAQLVDTASGTAQVTAQWEYIQDVCFGEDGILYLMTQEPAPDFDQNVIVYSTQQGVELYKYLLDYSQLQFTSLVAHSISYAGGGGIFLLFGKSQILLWVDPAAEDFKLLVDLADDVVGLDDGWIDRETGYICTMDVQGRVYINEISGPEGGTCRRRSYVLEPDRVEVDPVDMVTLTITAPYQVDSIAGAIRAYQREHPEVEFVWDTQFLSREELQKNSMEYKDQIALRVMTGDVGDLVMVTGSGLGAETMTETDAFADLSAALDACPVLDEIPDNFLAPLRGENGATRGLPLGILPCFYTWNQDLLEELGIDPYTVTWSQLLDLALDWKEQGTDLSLEIYEAGLGLWGSPEQMLDDILLANLYDAPQAEADGSVRLDQPYLRELLEKLKALYDSPQLVRRDGDGSKALILGAQITGHSVSDCLAWVQYTSAKNEYTPFLAPLPLGEVSQKRQGYAFCWAISQRSENKEAAWEFLQHLASRRGMTAESGYSYTDDTLSVNLASQERWLTHVSARFWGSRFAESEMYFRQLQDAMDVPYIRFDQPTGWYAAVAEPIGKYISGELTLDQAMGQANDNWERFLLE